MMQGRVKIRIVHEFRLAMSKRQTRHVACSPWATEASLADRSDFEIIETV
jgi:hypothetical protein